MRLPPIKREEPFDLTNSVIMVNPDYELAAAFRRNCQRCAVAFELRRRGYDVEAMHNPWPNRSGTTRRRSFNGTQCFKNAEVKTIGGFPPSIARQKLIETLEALPVNARAAIYWMSDGKEPSSHIIICEKTADGLVIGDPQTGFVGDDALKLSARDFGYRCYRMDNLELDFNFEWHEIIRKARK